MAYAARHEFAFLDPRRQGRFEALIRDLAGVSLLEATLAMADGRVRLGGQPYVWEADEMAYWLRTEGQRGTEVAEERERARFTVAPRR
jgi:hypothetical protein